MCKRVDVFCLVPTHIHYTRTHYTYSVLNTHICYIEFVNVSSEYILAKQSLSAENVMSFLNRPKINYWKKLDLVNEASVCVLALGLFMKTITSHQIRVATRVVLPSLSPLVLSACDLKRPSYEKEWKERNPRQNSCRKEVTMGYYYH